MTDFVDEISGGEPLDDNDIGVTAAKHVILQIVAV